MKKFHIPEQNFLTDLRTSRKMVKDSVDIEKKIKNFAASRIQRI